MTQLKTLPFGISKEAIQKLMAEMGLRTPKKDLNTEPQPQLTPEQIRNKARELGDRISDLTHEMNHVINIGATMDPASTFQRIRNMPILTIDPPPAELLEEQARKVNEASLRQKEKTLRKEREEAWPQVRAALQRGLPEPLKIAPSPFKFPSR